MALFNLNADGVSSRLCEPKSLHEVASDKYSPFVKKMQGLLVVDGENDSNSCSKALMELVGINVTCAAEELIPHDIRASQGIFFTGDIIAEKIALSFSAEIFNEASFFDPSCGAGNLLLAIAKTYPLKGSVLETLRFWGLRFGGCDLNESFILATKLRLIALAFQRHELHRVTKRELDGYLKLFSLFEVGDYLESVLGSEFDCIVANPPFGHITAPAGTEWSTGRTQQAGVFIAKALRVAKSGQKLTAVLPDVLRSGTRYERWRRFVEGNSTVKALDVHGRFSRTVDVDVFLLSVVQSDEENDSAVDKWQSIVRDESLDYVKLSSVFEVRVGPVVPHRLSGKGALVPYLTTQDAPPFAKVVKLPKINFGGTLYLPPFVVVRRTSSPSDKARLVFSLVQGSKAIAVENHLLILKPKDGTIEKCLNLIEEFKLQRINDWLNSVSRCRHLTTRILADINIVRGRYE